MKGIKVDFDKRTIVMTRAFAKMAADPFTTEFKMLQEVRKDYPEFMVKKHTIKKNANKECYKGLNYDFMREYIKTHEAKTNVDSALAELEDMIFISRCHSSNFRYPTNKKWFLDKYKEVASFGKDMRDVDIQNGIEINFSKAMDIAAA